MYNTHRSCGCQIAGELDASWKAGLRGRNRCGRRPSAQNEGDFGPRIVEGRAAVASGDLRARTATRVRRVRLSTQGVARSNLAAPTKLNNSFICNAGLGPYQRTCSKRLCISLDRPSRGDFPLRLSPGRTICGVICGAGCAGFR